MRSEEFLAGMKNVDADLIEEAAPKSTGVGGKIARGVLKGVAAAALCAVVAGGVFLASRKYVAPPSAGTDAESTDSETGLAATSGSKEVTEAARNGGAVDPLDELIKAVNSEKGMTVKELYGLVAPYSDQVTLRILSIENRFLVPVSGDDPQRQYNLDIKTCVPVMVSSFYYGKRFYEVYSMDETGFSPFEYPELYSLELFSENARPLRYNISEPKVQRSKIVAVKELTATYSQDFSACMAQRGVGSSGEPVSLDKAVLLDSSAKLLLSDLILPEGMEFRGCIVPLDRQTGEECSYSWGFKFGTYVSGTYYSGYYDKVVKKYEDLGSPVISFSFGTAVYYKVPNNYEKRYSVQVILPDSALDYVLKNLKDELNSFDGEFVQGLLKQTGTDLPVLRITETLTDPFLFYAEDEMLAAAGHSQKKAD